MLLIREVILLQIFFSFTCRDACNELFRGFITSRAILFQTSAREGVEQSEGIQFILASCISVSIWIIGMELHSVLVSILGVIIFPYRLGVLPHQFMVFLFGVLPTECQNFSMYVVLWLYNAQLFHSLR